MKALHRLIVTSATYRQSSHARPDLALVDPLNHLLARQTRLRLDAELVRDAVPRRQRPARSEARADRRCTRRNPTA
jgi:hypothetical protein